MARPSLVPAGIAPAVQDCETLSAILRELVALRADVAALANRLPASSPDSSALSGLLAAIHDSVAERVFSAGELLAHADVDAALRAAIVGTFGAASARRIGKALARAEGECLGGFAVARVGADRTGTSWQVRVTPL